MGAEAVPGGSHEPAPAEQLDRLRRALRAAEQRASLAEEALRRAERRHRMVLNSALDDAILLLDREGRITLWNDGAGRVLGWTESEMLEQPADRMFTPADLVAGIPAREMQAAVAGGRGSDERWYLRKDGSRFWAKSETMPLHDRDGALNGFVRILRDRTDQRRSAEKMRADAEFLHSVLASSADCIKILELDGSLSFMSEGGQRVMEVSDFNAIRGCSWPDFWQGPGNEAALDALDAARNGMTGRFRGKADTLAGNPRFWDVQVTPIFGPDGKPEKLLSVSRDLTAVRDAERAREASQQCYRSLYQTIDAGFCIIEVDCDDPARPLDYRFIEVNAAFEQQTDLRNAVGRSMRDLVPEHEQHWFEFYAAVARSGRPGRCTFQARALGNRHYDVHAYRIGEPRDRQVAILFSDVTERRQAENHRAALMELDDRFREMTDLATMTALAAELTGRTIEASSVGYGLLEEGDLHVAHFWTVSGHAGLAGRHRLRDYGTYEADLHRGEIVGIDDVRLDPRTAASAGALEQLHCRAFINLPVIEQGRLVAIVFVQCNVPRGWTPAEVSFVRDVAERTRAAIARRRAEADLRLLAASLEQQVAERTRDRNRLWQLSRDLMLVADFTGTITAVNPAWTETLGWQDEELVGRRLFELIHPDDLARTVEAAGEIAATGRTFSRFENRYRRKSGEHCWIAWTAGPADGFIIAVGRDITEEKDQAAALRQAEDALRQAQKMEAVGQLTGGLAHDFNNLLTGITGSLELLQTRAAQGRFSEVERYVGAAQGAAKRAAALTHRLLAFSRRQTLDPRPTDVNRLVSGMEELIRRTAGPAVAVQVDAAERPWTALVDASQLENALLNLCINARDAMPDGGRIGIGTANRHLDDREALERALPAGDYLCLWVSDTGIGMSQELATRIFDPFFTTKPLGQGTGLGLSMVYGFVRQTGGQVDVRSAPGEGTTILLLLPRHHGACEDEPADPALADAAARAGHDETVLVVDDEPTVRMLVTEVLQELGYRAVEAADGAAALKLLQTGMRIDLLVTDVGLPGGMNGRQLADAARVGRPDLKVLFITGYAEIAVIGNERLGDGMQVLTKPFTIDALANRIRATIGDP